MALRAGVAAPSQLRTDGERCLEKFTRAQEQIERLPDRGERLLLLITLTQVVSYEIASTALDAGAAGERPGVLQ